MHRTYASHTPYMHCTKLLINEFYKITIDATKYVYWKLLHFIQNVHPRIIQIQRKKKINQTYALASPIFGFEMPKECACTALF